jgi:hypothetical protein
VWFWVVGVARRGEQKPGREQSFHGRRRKLHGVVCASLERPRRVQLAALVQLPCSPIHACRLSLCNTVIALVYHPPAVLLTKCNSTAVQQHRWCALKENVGDERRSVCFTRRSTCALRTATAGCGMDARRRDAAALCCEMRRCGSWSHVCRLMWRLLKDWGDGYVCRLNGGIV